MVAPLVAGPVGGEGAAAGVGWCWNWLWWDPGMPPGSWSPGPGTPPVRCARSAAKILVLTLVVVLLAPQVGVGLVVELALAWLDC